MQADYQALQADKRGVYVSSQVPQLAEATELALLALLQRVFSVAD
jgi:hypothetical protein